MEATRRATYLSFQPPAISEDEIEDWGFRDGRVFAAVGSFEDEANPDSPHGWMIRLIDASALRAAGFSWARKATLSA